MPLKKKDVIEYSENIERIIYEILKNSPDDVFSPKEILEIINLFIEKIELEELYSLLGKLVGENKINPYSYKGEILFGIK